MNAHKALVQAISGNADPAKPAIVLGQALESLRLEADSMVDAFAERDNDLSCRLIYFAGRIAAIEEYVDCLRVEYGSNALEDAFAFDETEEQGNGASAEAAQ